MGAVVDCWPWSSLKFAIDPENVTCLSFLRGVLLWVGARFELSSGVGLYRVPIGLGATNLGGEMKSTLLAVTVFVAVARLVQAQAVTEFAGRPVIKISKGGSERNPEDLPRERAVNLECVISKIGDDYFWASRENTAHNE